MRYQTYHVTAQAVAVYRRVSKLPGVAVMPQELRGIQPCLEGCLRQRTQQPVIQHTPAVTQRLRAAGV